MAEPEPNLPSLMESKARFEKLRRIAWLMLLATGVALAGVGSGIIPINLFFLKDTLEQTIGEATGMEIRLQGPARLRMGPRPAFSLEQASIVSPGEATASVFEIAQLRVGFQLFKALRGEFVLTDILARQMTLDYCRLLQHDFPESASESESLSISVHRFSLESLDVRCSDSSHAVEWMPDHVSATGRQVAESG